MEKNIQKKIQIFLCSKNGKKNIQKNIQKNPEKNPKKSGFFSDFLDGRSFLYDFWLNP